MSNSEENEKEVFSIRNRNPKKPLLIELEPDEVALIICADGKLKPILDQEKVSKYGALLTVIIAAITDPRLFKMLLKEYSNTEMIKKLTKEKKDK